MPTPADDLAAEMAVSFGRVVRDRRLLLGLDLAHVADRAGVSVSFLSDVERGRSLPSMPNLVRLAVGLETDVVTLLQGVWPFDPKGARFREPPPDGRSSRTPQL